MATARLGQIVASTASRARARIGQVAAQVVPKASPTARIGQVTAVVSTASSDTSTLLKVRKAGAWVPVQLQTRASGKWTNVQIVGWIGTAWSASGSTTPTTPTNPPTNPPDSDGFTLGTTKPSASNTGVPAGTTLRQMAKGDILLRVGTTQPAGITGTGSKSDPFILTALDIPGRVRCEAYARIKWCNIHPTGTDSGITNNDYNSDTGCVITQSSSVPAEYDAVVVERCDLHPDRAIGGLNGIIGHGFTSLRNNIRHTTDAHSAYCAAPATDAYVKIQGTYAHDLVYFQTGNVASDGSHSDCLQMQGGAHWRIVGNFFDGRFGAYKEGSDSTLDTDSDGSLKWVKKSPTDASTGVSPWGTYNANSAIQMNQNVTTLSDVEITDNWFAGGRVSTINFSAVKADSYGYFDQGVAYRRNRFIRSPKAGYTVPPWTSSNSAQNQSPGWPINTSDSRITPNPTFVGNVWADDGTAVPIYAGSGTVAKYAA